MAGRRTQVTGTLKRLAPAIPRFDLDSAADRAMDSPGLRHAAPETAAWLALVSHVRHVHTDYDSLLDDGYDRDAARFFVVDAMNQTLGDWDCRQRVSGMEDIDDPGA